MASRRRLLDIWSLMLISVCIIFAIGLCDSSKDVDHSLSKGNKEHVKDSHPNAFSSHDEAGFKGRKDEDSDNPGASDNLREEGDPLSDPVLAHDKSKNEDGTRAHDSQDAGNVGATNEESLGHGFMPDADNEKHEDESRFDSGPMDVGLNKNEGISKDQESLDGLVRETDSTGGGHKDVEHMETMELDSDDYGNKMNSHEDSNRQARNVEVVAKDGKDDGMDNVFKRVTEMEGNRKTANLEETKEELVTEVVEKYFGDPNHVTSRDWKFFTVKPYINLLKTVVKKLDPAITDIIFMLPPSLQSLFLRAPLNMYPTHAFLLFTMSCLSLLVIFISRIFRGDSQHSKIKELKGLLFEAKGAVLLKQIEKDEISQELKEITGELKQKEALLEDGTVEMNRNLKAIIKECDTLKEDVSKKMELSKETRSVIKKVDSDILKQSHVSKEIKESVASIKNQMKQIQDNRDELQSSLDESDLNSIKLEEKIQSLQDQFELLEDSFEQLSSMVQAKDKEVEDLKDIVDALRLKCSRQTNLIRSRETENKTMRCAILQSRVMKVLLGKNSCNSEDGNDDSSDTVDSTNKEQFDIGEKIKHLADIALLRGQADEIEKEKNALMKSLSQEVEAKANLNDELKKVAGEMEKLEQMKEAAEQQMVASTTKIDVLSSYYKDREREYLRMLQEKEAKERAMSSQMKSADEKYKEVEKMANDYKNRVENLKKELEMIRIDYEKQIEAQEKRLHENMVSSRQAERDYEWKKQEASIMRERLLQVKDRIKYLQSKLSMQKSSDSLNSSINKEDVGASRLYLPRENTSSPSESKLPAFPPFPPRPGTILPPFMNRGPPPPPWLLPPMIPSFTLRPRDDSPASDRFRDIPPNDSLDERDRFSFSRNKSPTKVESSSMYRNRHSPPTLKHDPNAKPTDSHHPERGLGSQRTMNNV